jgi:hypothetical protein
MRILRLYTTKTVSRIDLADRSFYGNSGGQDGLGLTQAQQQQLQLHQLQQQQAQLQQQQQQLQQQGMGRTIVCI